MPDSVPDPLAVPETHAAPAPTLPSPARRTGWRPWPVHWTVIPLGCVALLLLFRQPAVFSRPQFWAEDGAVLFLQARSFGWGSLFRPHPAYFILGPRLVACMASVLPTLYLPYAYCGGALAYTLLTAWYCLRARLDGLVDRQGRIALALALVLVPHNGEVLMKLIGSQWVLMPILLLLMLQAPPVTRGQAVADFAGLVFAGLTGPFIVLYAPWFLLRLRASSGGRSPYNLWLIGTAFLLAAVQGWEMHHLGMPDPTFTRSAAQWAYQLARRMPAGLFLGARLPRYLGASIFVLSPILLALLGWAVWRGERKRRWAVLALLGCGLISYAGGLKTVAPGVVVLNPFGDGGRYFYPLYLFSMWVGVLYCFDVSEHLRTAARVALMMMLCASASDFSCSYINWLNFRWDVYAPLLDKGDAVDAVPILPAWKVDFPAKDPPAG